MAGTGELSNYFQNLLSDVDGALALLVTDRSGVPIVKVLSGKCPESATRSSFLSTFATATEQASKLGLSKNKRMICMFESFQLSLHQNVGILSQNRRVVMFNYLPLVVTVIGSSTTNTGILMDLETEFQPIIEKLKSTVIAKN